MKKLIPAILALLLGCALVGCAEQEAPQRAVVAPMKKSAVAESTYCSTEDEFLSLILHTTDILADDTVEMSTGEFETKYGQKLMAPGKLPERFKLYDAVFVTDADGEAACYSRLWYDVNSGDLLTVTQSAVTDMPESEFSFRAMEESDAAAKDMYYWADCICSRASETADGSVQGYMIVAGRDKCDECRTILESIE